MKNEKRTIDMFDLREKIKETACYAMDPGYNRRRDEVRILDILTGQELDWYVCENTCSGEVYLQNPGDLSAPYYYASEA